MPDPKEGESREDFISRCIPVVLEDGTADGQNQAVAICSSMWESKKMDTITGKAVWTRGYINNLPDSSFLYIVPGCGEKDEERRTKPRTCRKFPYRNLNGNVDLSHLRNALARIPQADLPQDVRARLTAKAQRLLESETEKSMDELLVFSGGSIKALGEGKIGGHLIVFGDPDNLDLEDDFFTAETDFDLSEGKTSSVYYSHGLDPSLKRRKLGNGALEADDVGIWIEAQLQLRDDYEEALYNLASEGKLGWSSGTATHLVEREEAEKGFWIKSWPLGLDASLTPTPAEPRTKAIPLKSYTCGVDLKSLLAGGDPPDKDGDPSTMANLKEAAELTADIVRIYKGVRHGSNR